MSDNTEPPPSLVAELRALADKYMTEALRQHRLFSDKCNLVRLHLPIAERHEARWQADRAALVARAEAAEKRLGELLAVIFGDGGHRQSEIGDAAEAVRQAHERIAADRQRLETMRESVAELEVSGAPPSTPGEKLLSTAYRHGLRTAAERIRRRLRRGRRMNNAVFDKVHAARLTRLADHLEHGELGLGEFVFSIYYDTLPCGTAGCAIGECVHLFSQDWTLTPNKLPRLRVDPPGPPHEPPVRGGMRFFGLSRLEFESLFTPYRSYTVYDLPQLSYRASRGDVAANIRAFLAHKGAANE